MKRSMVKFGIIAVISAAILCSCIKLKEDVSEEHISRPQYDVDISNPTWEQGNIEGEEIGK